MSSFCAYWENLKTIGRLRHVQELLADVMRKAPEDEREMVGAIYREVDERTTLLETMRPERLDV